MATKVSNGLDLQSQNIINVLDPTSAQHAATKSYVDAAIRGVQWKPTVRAAAPGNITSLSAPGATIDGVTMVSGDRLLLANQTTTSQNGIWIWNGASSALTRTTGATGDFNTASTQQVGEAVTVEAGTTYGGKAMMLLTSANANPEIVVVDTDGHTWGLLGGAGSSYSAGNGLQLSTNTFSVKNADSTITVAAGGISVNSSALTFTKKYSQTLTSGSTSYTVTHALGTDVLVQIWDASGNFVIADMTTSATSGGQTVITFGTTTSQSYRCVVIG